MSLRGEGFFSVISDLESVFSVFLFVNALILSKEVLIRPNGNGGNSFVPVPEGIIFPY